MKIITQSSIGIRDFIEVSRVADEQCCSACLGSISLDVNRVFYPEWQAHLPLKVQRFFCATSYNLRRITTTLFRSNSINSHENSQSIYKKRRAFHEVSLKRRIHRWMEHDFFFQRSHEKCFENSTTKMPDFVYERTYEFYGLLNKEHELQFFTKLHHERDEIWTFLCLTDCRQYNNRSKHVTQSTTQI